MATYRTESITAAVRWVDECHGLGSESRSNLVNLLNSPEFKAVLDAHAGCKMVIDYDQASDLAAHPRRVLLDVPSEHNKVVITGDRGAWILNASID